MPAIKANGVQLYYEIHGKGPRLLFIGGTGGDLRKTPNVFASPLVQHFEVLAFDQRGLGRSEKPDIAYSMIDYAADAAALLKVLQWPAVPVLGVSFGGMVAQELALGFASQVSQLGLCCTSSGGAGGHSYPLHELQNLPEEQRLRKSLAISDNRCDELWQQQNPDAVSAMLDFMRKAAAVGRDEPGHLMGAKRQLAARQHHDTWSRLSSLDLPVFVAGGIYDALAPAENMKNLARVIAAAKLKWFQGGHLFLQQDKAAYAWLIEQLLAATNRQH